MNTEQYIRWALEIAQQEYKGNMKEFKEVTE
jgi:hypothetical protein